MALYIPEPSRANAYQEAAIRRHLATAGIGEECKFCCFGTDDSTAPLVSSGLEVSLLQPLEQKQHGSGATLCCDWLRDLALAVAWALQCPACAYSGGLLWHSDSAHLVRAVCSFFFFARSL